MENKDLKKVLGKIAQDNEYNTDFGIWYKEISNVYLLYPYKNQITEITFI